MIMHEVYLFDSVHYYSDLFYLTSECGGIVMMITLIKSVISQNVYILEHVNYKGGRVGVTGSIKSLLVIYIRTSHFKEFSIEYKRNHINKSMN